MRKLLKILAEEVAACTKCDLHKTRIQTVFARGNPNAKLMIVAEGPGQQEDQEGFPLVGVSGQLLDKVLKELDCNSNEGCYIANIIKCRPPNNRKPTDEEINHCFGYLEQQISLVKPKVIVALGNTAVSTLTNTPFGISKVRGKVLKFNSIPVYGTWHPSYVLRNGATGKVLEEFKADLQLAINKSKESQL